MDHIDRKPRCTSGGLIKPISTALYGLYVCHLQYTPIAPQFLWWNRMAPPSYMGALDAGDSAAFSGIFLASSFFCSQAESTPAPAPVPRGQHAGLTQTVGRQSKMSNEIIDNCRKENISIWKITIPKSTYGENGYFLYWRLGGPGYFGYHLYFWNLSLTLCQE